MASGGSPPQRVQDEPPERLTLAEYSGRLLTQPGGVGSDSADVGRSMTSYPGARRPDSVISSALFHRVVERAEAQVAPVLGATLAHSCRDVLTVSQANACLGSTDFRSLYRVVKDAFKPGEVTSLADVDRMEATELKKLVGDLRERSAAQQRRISTLETQLKTADSDNKLLSAKIVSLNSELTATRASQATSAAQCEHFSRLAESHERLHTRYSAELDAQQATIASLGQQLREIQEYAARKATECTQLQLAAANGDSHKLRLAESQLQRARVKLASVRRPIQQLPQGNRPSGNRTSFIPAPSDPSPADEHSPGCSSTESYPSDSDDQFPLPARSSARQKRLVGGRLRSDAGHQSTNTSSAAGKRPVSRSAKSRAAPGASADFSSVDSSAGKPSGKPSAASNKSTSRSPMSDLREGSSSPVGVDRAASGSTRNHARSQDASATEEFLFDDGSHAAHPDSPDQVPVASGTFAVDDSAVPLSALSAAADQVLAENRATASTGPAANAADVDKSGDSVHVATSSKNSADAVGIRRKARDDAIRIAQLELTDQPPPVPPQPTSAPKKTSAAKGKRKRVAPAETQSSPATSKKPRATSASSAGSDVTQSLPAAPTVSAKKKGKSPATNKSSNTPNSSTRQRKTSSTTSKSSSNRGRASASVPQPSAGPHVVSTSSSGTGSASATAAPAPPMPPRGGSLVTAGFEVADQLTLDLWPEPQPNDKRTLTGDAITKVLRGLRFQTPSGKHYWNDVRLFRNFGDESSSIGSTVVPISASSFSSFLSAKPWESFRGLQLQQPLFFNSTQTGLKTLVRQWNRLRDQEFQAFWERDFWIPQAAVLKYLRQHPNARLKSEWRAYVSQRKARADSLRFHYGRFLYEAHSLLEEEKLDLRVLVDPSLPFYSSSPLIWTPQTSNWLGELNVLYRDESYRGSWLTARWVHPYQTVFRPTLGDRFAPDLLTMTIIRQPEPASQPPAREASDDDGVTAEI